MKNLISILCFVLIGLTISAQSTSPRFGTTKTQDNTGRNLTYGVVTYSDVTGNDSINVSTNYFETIVTVNVKDSVTLGAPVITNAFYGDKLTIYIVGASNGNKVRFSAYKTIWIGAGTVTLSTGKIAYISYIFNGAKWIETGRAVY